MTKTILIVDEGRLARTMMKAVIQLHRLDWRVLEAASVDEALALAERGDIDLVTIDETVSGVSGMNLARRLREYLPRAWIAMSTHHVAETPLPSAAEVGMRLMPKPLTDERIRELVDAA